jgi:hypothetical protein
MPTTADPSMTGVTLKEFTSVSDDQRLISSSASLSKMPTTANPSMTGVTLKEFTLFPKLPIEIRFMIWMLAVLPRLVG